jgi:hypothetical protein
LRVEIYSNKLEVFFQEFLNSNQSLNDVYITDQEFNEIFSKFEDMIVEGDGYVEVELTQDRNELKKMTI